MPPPCTLARVQVPALRAAVRTVLHAAERWRRVGDGVAGGGPSVPLEIWLCVMERLSGVDFIGTEERIARRKAACGGFDVNSTVQWY